MLWYSQRQARKERISNIEFVRGDVSRLPFRDRTFAVVISVFGFHELLPEERYRAVAEAVRVLRPDGRLIEVCGAGLRDLVEEAGLEVVAHQSQLGDRVPFQFLEGRRRISREADVRSGRRC